MNKKFSTLVASVLLAAGVGNANAAVTAGFTAYPGPYTAVSVTDATTLSKQVTLNQFLVKVISN